MHPFPVALLALSASAVAQVSSAPVLTVPVSAAAGVTFNVLSDTKGTQLNSYLAVWLLSCSGHL